MPTMTVKGQVTIPKEVRESAGIRPGDRVEAVAEGPGSVLVRRVPAPDAGRALDEAIAEIRRRGLHGALTADEVAALTRD
jgi:AbrB family looped-hinge helix DNA binding protein